MPDNLFLHQHSEFKNLISIIAKGQGIDPYLVEKDYWIMHCLFGLQEAGYNFELKGGTSLSKGYGIIHRFSEDIDIHIEPPAKLILKTGKNHDKPEHLNARRNYYGLLAEEISIDDIETSRDTTFDSDNFMSGGVRLHYEAKFDIGGSAAKAGVLLEVGFDNVAPNRPIDISSWAYDHAAPVDLGVIDNRAKGVLCYEPGYTFVEKLDAIARKYRQYCKGKEFPENFMRHYHDIYCLLLEDSVQKFIGTDAYNAHKRKRFSPTDYDAPIAENQAFLLEKPEDFEFFKNEYKNKKALYYKGQPSFEDVISTIRKHVATL